MRASKFGLTKPFLSQVVLLPVLAGAFMNQYFQRVVKFVTPLMAPIAVGTVAILCGTAIGQNASAILASGKQVVMACVLLHLSGFLFGYLFSRLLRIDVASSRTVSIEVGMQVRHSLWVNQLSITESQLKLFLCNGEELGAWTCSSGRAFWEPAHCSTVCCF